MSHNKSSTFPPPILSWGWWWNSQMGKTVLQISLTRWAKSRLTTLSGLKVNLGKRDRTLLRCNTVGRVTASGWRDALALRQRTLSDGNKQSATTISKAGKQSEETKWGAGRESGDYSSLASHLLETIDSIHGSAATITRRAPVPCASLSFSAYFWGPKILLLVLKVIFIAEWSEARV